jgi:hypothetical protein
MKSVRTTLNYGHSKLFREFLNDMELGEVIVGDYEATDAKYYTQKSICYCYREKSIETVAILTFLVLKYGSIEDAYKQHKFK